MKSTNIAVCLILLLQFCSCKNNDDQKTNDYSRAIAQKSNGIYVFIKSKPVSSYDYLGTLQLNWYDKILELYKGDLQSAIHNVTSIVSFSENLDHTLTEIKLKYPTADGVIFDDTMSKCEIIKFKN